MVKRMGSREILKLVKGDGWFEFSQAGSHLHLKHPSKPGKVSIPVGRKDLPPKTLLSICRQAKIKAPR